MNTPIQVPKFTRVVDANVELVVGWMNCLHIEYSAAGGTNLKKLTKDFVLMTQKTVPDGATRLLECATFTKTQTTKKAVAPSGNIGANAHLDGDPVLAKETEHKASARPRWSRLNQAKNALHSISSPPKILTIWTTRKRSEKRFNIDNKSTQIFSWIESIKLVFSKI